MIGNRQVNYAVATGLKSEVTGKYLVVVDVDDPKHPILKTLTQKTFCYKTGSGGFHFWFWSSVEMKNSVGKLAAKVDIRGTGGYVIIPPSQHVSGNKYELMSPETQEIADLPVSLFNLLTEHKTLNTLDVSGDKKYKRTNKISDDLCDVVKKWWTEQPVSDIRKSLSAGVKVPNGVRNVCLHRLLSSDRAKGIATFEDLTQKALEYAQLFENSTTFDQKEIKNVVCSVMKYPVYNTLYENVNKNYCKWMKKKHDVEINEEMLSRLDKEFFSQLKKTDKGGMSLDMVARLRQEWYAHVHGMKDGFARYKSQLLAKKLEALGFEKTRTSKNNIWKLSFDLPTTTDSDTLTEETLEKTTQMTTEATKKTRTSKAKSKPLAKETVLSKPEETSEKTEAAGTTEVTEATGPVGPDGSPLTFVEEREEFIETDRKYHPNDGRYVGHASTQEIMMGTVRFLSKLTPEQSAQLQNNELLFDEERTNDFYDFLEVGDIVGVKTNAYKILAKDEDDNGVRSLLLSKKTYNRYDRKYEFSGEEERLSLYDLDFALSIGACEILYRNDKPYGVDNELSYKVKLRVYSDSVGRTYVFRSGKSVEKTSKTQSSETSKNDKSTSVSEQSTS